GGTLLAVRLIDNKQPPVAVNPEGPKSPESPKQEDPSKDKNVAANPEIKSPEVFAPKKQTPRPNDVERFRNISNESTAGRADPDQIALQQRIQRLRKEYVEAIDILSASVNKRKSKLDPKLLAVFNRNLGIVNETIAATRKAYDANPRDAEVAQYMLTAYSKKI